MKQWWHPTWLGILYMIVGAYLLIRHRTEADRTIEWASQAHFFGGMPRPLGRFSAALIRICTLVAGAGAFVLGLLSVIGASSCLATR